jgi:hypothetical protein
VLLSPSFAPFRRDERKGGQADINITNRDQDRAPKDRAANHFKPFGETSASTLTGRLLRFTMGGEYLADENHQTSHYIYREHGVRVGYTKWISWQPVERGWILSLKATSCHLAKKWATTTKANGKPMTMAN